VDALKDKKNQIEQAITQTILNQIEKETLTVDESSEIVSFCLEKIKALNTEEEMTSFLLEISAKWPIFSGIATLEQGKAKEEQKDEAVDNVVSLVKSGNLEEALDMAKSANNN
jgi:hypothetical protein